MPPPLTKEQANQARLRSAAASRDVRGDQATLDKFAAEALNGILSAYATWQGGGELDVKTIAKRAYACASEMMYARSVRDELGVVLEENQDDDED